jgi:Zn-dependent metalloprotease
VTAYFEANFKRKGEVEMSLGNINRQASVNRGLIPQEMLKAIARNGTDEQKDRALHNLSLSGFIRGQRSVLGQVAFITAAAPSQKCRSVYTANEATTLPGTLVRNEGGPASTDIAVNEAYDGTGATHDLYIDVYGRNSINDNGMCLVSTTHFDVNYGNAFWNGSQMVFGDGDGEIFAKGGFTRCIDVIAHELTHGVTQYEADLIYNNQPGALNESFSDVMGILVKQRALGQTADQSNWLLAEGIFAPGINGVALRSMKDPGTAYDDPLIGKDPQPGHMKDFVKTSSDSGGVHINSGIPNRAFYYAAVEIGGNAWEKAGMIWYITLRDRLRPSSKFVDAAKATVQVAGNLFKVGSLEQKAVKRAWGLVGINVK